MRVCVAVLAGLAVFLLAGLESTNAEQGGKCTPGAPLKEIGRPCWCNSRGVVVCSKVLLPNNPGAIKATLPALKEPEEEESECKDGDVWQQECNTCRCIGGHAACTRKQCRGPTRPSDRQVCVPGETWNDGCNTCSCSPSGTPSCTEKFCVSRTTRQATCKPGDTWFDGCNNCACSESGVPFCTLKYCAPKRAARATLFGAQYLRVQNGTPLSEQAQLLQPSNHVSPACKPGDTWFDGCNNCACSESGVPFCTLKYCAPKRVARAANDCKPGDSWFDGCNNCHCTSTGVAVCTLKYCGPTRVARAATGRTCKPGDNWNEDCNRCFCAKDGTPACTRRACF